MVIYHQELSRGYPGKLSLMLSGLCQMLMGILQFLQKIVTPERCGPFLQNNPAAKPNQAVSPRTVPLLPAKLNVMEKENNGGK